MCLIASGATRNGQGALCRGAVCEIKGIAGIDTLCEALENPEIMLQTVGRTPEENTCAIMAYWQKRVDPASGLEL